MAHLAAGKRAGFERICSRMWDQFGKTVNSNIAQLAVFTIVLAPRPIDTIPMVDLEMYGPGDPAFGAVLYRAGKWEEAVHELEQSALKSVGFRQAWCWMFLAMAHGRLGHAATAREFLENGRRWIDGAGANELGSPNWTRRVQLQTLRREAEDLLNEKSRAARR
jgi:hypothetical protein